MIDEFKQAVEFLSQKLGPSADKVYELSVKQAYVDAATAIIATAIFLGIGFVFFKWGEAERKEDKYSDIYGLFYLGAGLAVSIALITFFASNTITALFNPEYYALTKLFSLVK